MFRLLIVASRSDWEKHFGRVDRPSVFKATLARRKLAQLLR